VPEILGALRTAKFLRARELGGISLTFRVDLEGGGRCALKPEIRGQRQKWNGEVAAWRIARLLGLDPQVPPAVSRRISRDEILRVLGGDERTAAARGKLAADAAWDERGSVAASVTHWIPNVQARPLEREVEAWRPWLRAGRAIPDDQKALAAQIADLLVFDHVIGNWDRLSGGGFLFSREGSRLYFTDHNAAFYSPMPREAAGRLQEHFALVERFSRRLTERLRTLDAAKIRTELARDGGGARILRDDQIADILTRRDEVLQKVRSLVAAHGEAEVLAFE